MNSIDTILYDLDGTLIDSNELIIHSFAHTLQIHRSDLVFTRKDYIEMIGPPLKATFAQYALNEIELENMVETYFAYYQEHELQSIKPFEGMLEAVTYFRSRGYKQAIVTTKFHRSAKASIQAYGLDQLVDTVVALDDVVNPKPHQEPLLLALSRVRGTKALMVGDTVSDLQAAKNAGMKAVGVTYSLKKELLEAEGADYWIQNGFDLIQYIQNQNEEVN